jgi:hypothetical protein
MLDLRVFQSQTAMKPIAYLIFNPVAGRGNPEQELATIESILGEELELKIYRTTPETCAEDLAIQAIAQQPELIEVKSIPLGLNIFVPGVIPAQPETRLSGLPNLEIHDRLPKAGLRPTTINAA